MTTLREAAQQAIEAHDAHEPIAVVMEALRTALAESEQEPVAHLWQHCETGRTRVGMPNQIITADAGWLVVGPLYLHPASDDTSLLRQALEALKNSREYIVAEYEQRKALYEGYPHMAYKYRAEANDLVSIDALITTLEKRLGEKT